MKIIVPSVGPESDQKTVDYVISIAKRLHAQQRINHSDMKFKILHEALRCARTE